MSRRAAAQPAVSRCAGAAGDAPRRFARFAGCTLDCAANALRAADASEHLLGSAEIQVLRVFVDRPHQILTREQLFGTRDLSALDRSIDVRISRLRSKTEADPQNAQIIQTVYGGLNVCSGRRVVVTLCCATPTPATTALPAPRGCRRR